MRNQRLQNIAFLACAALVLTMSAMTLVVNSADAQWESLFGVLSQRVAAQFSPPPSFSSAGSDRLALARNIYSLGYVSACVLFALLFRLRTKGFEHRFAFTNAALLAVQLTIAVSVETNLLYIFAAELAIVMPVRRAAVWFVALASAHVAQSIAIVYTLARNDMVARYGLLTIGMEIVYCLFAFGVATLAVLEQRGRAHLAAAHAELLATHALLADTARSAERLRIARDLHDSIGHHLTALNLHLDLADRQLGGTNSSLRTGRDLSRELLREVRTVVSAERSDQHIAIRQSLQVLCDAIPSPAIRLDVGDDVEFESAPAAHALFKCIQEAVSNALRHADASLLEVTVRRRGKDIGATIRDDGRGRGEHSEGNGLTGIRERLAALGGAMVASDPRQGGFQLDLSLPSAKAVQ